MNKLLLITSFLSAFFFRGYSQSTLIASGGDGGFENGSTFASNNWTVNVGQANEWKVGPNATAGFTGVNAAYITNTLTPTTHSYNIAVTTRIHLFRDIAVPAGESNISLSFSWMGMGESTNDRLRVWVITQPTLAINPGTAITANGAKLLQGNFNLQASWTNTTLTLPTSLAGTTFKLVFEWINNASLGTQPPVAIDNVSLISTCTGVTATSASSVLNTSAVLNWNTLSGATSYSVQYKGASSGTWLNAPGNPYSATSASLTGLSGATAYDYRVSAIGPVCNVYSAVSSFTTLCNPVTSLSYTEGFNTAGLPPCWSSALLSGTSNWTTTANNTFVTSPHSGAAFASVSGSASNALLISPQFDLNSVGTAAVQVNLWIYRLIPGNSDPNDSIVVYVNTSSNLTGATKILKIYPMMTIAPVESAAGWYNYTALIPASYITGGPFFVLIRGARAIADGIGIDDFTVELGPTCLPATALTINNVTNTGGTISWVTPTNGLPLNYNWEVRTSGAAGSGSTGLAASGAVAAPTTSATVTGLTGSTTYTLYVKSDCGAGDFSTWTSAYTFTTAPNCPKPTSLSVTAINANSAVLNWTAGGTETNWDLYYGASTIIPPTGSTIPMATTSVSSFTNTGLTPTTFYDFYVRANCGAGEISTWTNVKVYSTTCLSPDVLSTTSASLCGTGTLTLQATTDASSTLFWYANSFSGSPVATGSVYVTPSLTTTTNYYVSARGATSTYTVGKLTTTGAAFPAGNYLIFDALANFTITSVDLYAAGTGTGNVIIALQNSSGVTLKTTTVTLTGSASAIATTVPLNFSVTPGSNYRLNCLSMSGGVTGLYRDNTGFSYPYTAEGIVSITGNSNPANYNFFYNWMVEAGCESPRSMVTAYVTPIPTLSVSPSSSSICGGSQTTTLTVTSNVANFNSYVWSPVANLYTDAAATIPYAGGSANQLYVKSNATGVNTYSLNASNSVNGCVNSTSATVTVKEAPVNMSITATPSVICAGSPVSFSVSSGYTSGSINASDYTYSWTSSPTGFSATTASTSASPTISTTYSAVFTNTLSNCAISGTTAVTVNAYPTVTISPTSFAMCAGQTQMLTAGGATTYTWAPITNTTSVVVVSPTVTTAYSVTGSSNGCSASKTITVTINPVPTVTATSSQSIICVGESAVLTASTTSANLYAWTPGIANTMSITVTPTVSANYTVTVSNGTCTAYTTIDLTVNLCTGIHELSSGEIVLYPNPNFGILSVTVTDFSSPLTIEIYDVLGKLLLTEALTKEQSAINTSKLESGAYLYKISSPTKSIKVGRIVKQ
jgi:hypothetical protein